jgi:hypothetical protein
MTEEMFELTLDECKNAAEYLSKIKPGETFYKILNKMRGK